MAKKYTWIRHRKQEKKGNQRKSWKKNSWNLTGWRDDCRCEGTEEIYRNVNKSEFRDVAKVWMDVWKKKMGSQ